MRAAVSYLASIVNVVYLVMVEDLVRNDQSM